MHIHACMHADKHTYTHVCVSYTYINAKYTHTHIYIYIYALFFVMHAISESIIKLGTLNKGLGTLGFRGLGDNLPRMKRNNRAEGGSWC